MAADEFGELVAEAIAELDAGCQCGDRRWFHDDYLDAAYIVAVRHFGSSSLIATACWGEYIAAVKAAAETADQSLGQVLDFRPIHSRTHGYNGQEHR